MESERRLAAVMFTDIVGFTALMRRNEERALEVLEENRKIQRPIIEAYKGEWLKEIGDGILASFNSPSDALRCAAHIIHEARAQGIALRIGIHHGEMVFQQGDVFGDGVNIASRVETLASPNSVLFTKKVYDDIRNKPDINAVFLGPAQLKNVDEPIEIYALQAEGLEVPPGIDPSETGKKVSFRSLVYGIAGIVFVGLVIALFLFLDTGNREPGEPAAVEQTQMVSLAALPFSNISYDREIDFLGFALVDEVISNLAYLQNVVVRPSSAIRKYSNEVVDPKEAGDALGVKFILMGHYLRKEDSVRLNLELIDIEGNKVLWSGSIQEGMHDIFKLQDQVAQHVIDGLQIQFSQKEQTRMSKDVPTDPLAYEYYLKGLSYPNSVEGNQIAIQMLEKAIDLDSTFAPAFCELGIRQGNLAIFSLMEKRGVQLLKARANLEHSLELNDELLNAIGNLTLLYNELNQRDKALELARRLLEINPKSPLGHFSLGYIYRYTGIIDEAIKEMETAVELDPKNSRFRSIIVSYYVANRYKDALQVPIYQDGSGFSQCWRGLVYIKLGEKEKAQTELLQAIQIDPESMLASFCKGFLFYAQDSTAPEEWMEELRAVEQIDDSETLYFWSLINLIHGDKRGFLERFEKVVEDGYYAYPTFQKESMLDPLRDHPEFRRIMKIARDKHEAFKARYMR